MNWDFVRRVAHEQAHSYALQGGTHAVGSVRYSDRYNAYLTGYMDNAGERESLRAILERINPTTGAIKEKIETVDKLDDLV